MTDALSNAYTGFNGHRRIASGSLQAVALAAKRAIESGAADPVLIFDDLTGRLIDIDTRGSDEAVVARLEQPAAAENRSAVEQTERSLQPSQESDDTGAQGGEPRQRGRPKLGVVAREVTLLPRHWTWLAAQPGGASVAIRKLVEEARRDSSGKDKSRKAQERAYRFMAALVGDFPNFEDATRALFANNRLGFGELIAGWPNDVRDYDFRLAFGDDDDASRETMPTRYIEPTQDAGRAFVMRQLSGSIVMLNLLRFRQTADYSASPELAPSTPISGAAAFQRYIEHTLPYLRETGGDLLFLGAGGAFLIGPEAERWDMVMLVQQSSVESFLAFASHEGYLAGLGHRTAAIEDSRLLPLTEVTSAMMPPQ